MSNLNESQFGSDLTAAVNDYKAAGLHSHGVGQCESSMNTFADFAHQRGLQVERHEFNYPKASRFPSPHPDYVTKSDGDEPMWESWHHAASVVAPSGQHHVVDWTLGQFDAHAHVPHVEPLEHYSEHFAYRAPYDHPKD